MVPVKVDIKSGVKLENHPELQYIVKQTCQNCENV